MTIKEAIKKLEEKFRDAMANDNLPLATLWKEYGEKLETIEAVLEDGKL